MSVSTKNGGTLESYDLVLSMHCFNGVLALVSNAHSAYCIAWVPQYGMFQEDWFENAPAEILHMLSYKDFSLVDTFREAMHLFTQEAVNRNSWD